MAKKIILWVLAVLLMFAFVIYQRTTGPTHPYKGSFHIDIQKYKYSLIRTHETTGDARITLPVPNIPRFDATLHYKRLGTQDSITSLPFTLLGGEYHAYLPVQAAAGKMEYYVTLNANDEEFRIPEDEAKSIILRYKDPVPFWVLLPHVLFMFFAIVFGIRAGLSALFEPVSMRIWAIVCFILLTLGGMILGPFVQKYAFGEFWTGWPLGYDYTDNKTLIMWLGWLLVFILARWNNPNRLMVNRALVGGATIIMLMMYLIPHSMGGSTLDYDKVDQGVHPKEAIRTGGGR